WPIGWARTRRPVRDRLRATIPTGAIREAARVRWARGATVAPARTPPRRAARPKTRPTRTRRRRSRQVSGWAAGALAARADRGEPGHRARAGGVRSLPGDARR